MLDGMSPARKTTKVAPVSVRHRPVTFAMSRQPPTNGSAPWTPTSGTTHSCGGKRSVARDVCFGDHALRSDAHEQLTTYRISPAELLGPLDAHVAATDLGRVAKQLVEILADGGAPPYVDERERRR